MSPSANTSMVVSTAFKRDGWYPEIVAGMSQISAGAAEPMKQTPMYQLYARIAPKPADWAVLLTKLGELLRRDYDWSKDVAAIKAPTLPVFRDADAVRPAHAVQFFELLGGGKKDAGWDGSGMSNARSKRTIEPVAGIPLSVMTGGQSTPQSA